MLGLAIGVHLLNLLTLPFILLIIYFKKFDFNIKSFLIPILLSLIIFITIYIGIIKGIPDLMNKLNGNLECKNGTTISVLEDKNINSFVKRIKLPVFIKPIDSSGSKGVTKVKTYKEIDKAYEEGLDQTELKNVKKVDNNETAN